MKLTFNHYNLLNPSEYWELGYYDYIDIGIDKIAISGPSRYLWTSSAEHELLTGSDVVLTLHPVYSELAEAKHDSSQEISLGLIAELPAETAFIRFLIRCVHTNPKYSDYAKHYSLRM